jgi:hypothetical protein
MSAPVQNATTWWRWPLVPFVGLVAGAAAAIAFALFQWLGMKFAGGYSEDGWYFLYILPVITSGIFGYAFVISTHSVAPRGKFISSVVMTTILGLLLLLSVLLAWGPTSQSIGHSIQSTVGSIAALIAAIATLINIAQTEGTSA